MVILLVLLFLSACAAAEIPPTPPVVLPTQTITISPTLTSTPAPPAPSATPPPTPNPTPEICSPLSEYTLPQLTAQVSNPYNPPPLGSDEPHQGVDLAEFRPDSRVALAGMPVQAVLAGQVVGVIANRFPYGNSIIIETPLEGMNPGWVGRLNLPDALLGPLTGGPLSCPAYHEDWFGQQARSLYLLYSHLQDAPLLKMDDPVACGQTLGTVGESGNALNPHLHLEVRAGPAGSTFGSMAHYDLSASQEEMATYCLWRVSGAFLPIDPFCVLTGCEKE